jgi:HAD superfamily hydrolase (TIGR01509 family)
VIFDMDGVILDSERVWDDVRRGFVTERGGVWEADSQRVMMGMNTREWSGYLASLGVGMSAEDAAAEVLARVASRYRAALPVIAGAAEAVRRIARRWPVGLASSSSRSLIELALRRAALDGVFGAVVSSEEVRRGKPAPDVYLEAARRLGVDPGACVAVEDSSNGLRAAAAAGMTVVAVPNAHYAPGPAAVGLARLTVSRLADLRPDDIEALGPPRHPPPGR